MHACRPDSVSLRWVDARVAAAQSSPIMLQPRKDGSMICFRAPFRARAAIFENANLSRFQCDLQTLQTSNVNVTRPDWPTSTAGDGDDVVQRSGACIRFRA